MTRARDVADTQDNVGGAVPPFTAGKNKIINGDFGIWQRGTTTSTNGTIYLADRWCSQTGSTSGFTYSQSSFTAGTAPVAGYEGQFFADIAGTMSNASTGYIQLEQRIEDVRTLAGQTVTLSFWAKGSSSGTINTVLEQYFGATGSPSAQVLSGLTSFSITTSWTRYSVTVSLPNISGKIITAGNFLRVIIVKNMGSSYPTYGTSNYTGTLSIWGVQVEVGSVATPFTTATGTLAGELAACQRYYNRYTGVGQTPVGVGSANSTTTARVQIHFPVEMRTNPSVIDSGGSWWFWDGTNLSTATSFSGYSLYSKTAILSAASSSLTQFRPYFLIAANDTTAYIGFSAEL